MDTILGICFSMSAFTHVSVSLVAVLYTCIAYLVQLPNDGNDEFGVDISFAHQSLDDVDQDQTATSAAQDVQDL
jgi:hypothetical protein